MKSLKSGGIFLDKCLFISTIIAHVVHSKSKERCARIRSGSTCKQVIPGHHTCSDLTEYLIGTEPSVYAQPLRNRISNYHASLEFSHVSGLAALSARGSIPTKSGNCFFNVGYRGALYCLNTFTILLYLIAANRHLAVEFEQVKQKYDKKKQQNQNCYSMSVHILKIIGNCFCNRFKLLVISHFFSSG